MRLPIEATIPTGSNCIHSIVWSWVEPTTTPFPVRCRSSRPAMTAEPSPVPVSTSLIEPGGYVGASVGETWSMKPL